MFTAVAILQLVEAGKLQLVDPLAEYLTERPDIDLGSKVNIEQLLSHTGDIFGPEFDAHGLELRTLQDFAGLNKSRKLRFEPGSRWEYNNYGYILLGLVIERVSGQSYYDYVRDNVYAVVKMPSTGSEAEDQLVPDLSIGYTLAAGATMVCAVSATATARSE